MRHLRNQTYLKDLGNLASEGSVSDVDDGADLDGFGEGAVGASDAGLVTLNAVIRSNHELLAGLECDGLVVDEITSADLWALCVEHDGAGLVRALL